MLVFSANLLAGTEEHTAIFREGHVMTRMPTAMPDWEFAQI